MKKELEKRVIKFRAWDKGRKRWLILDERYGLGQRRWVDITFDGRAVRTTHDGTEGRFVEVREELEDIELVRFTGLLDKNGKEIYEGDILGLDTYANKLVVEWNKKQNGWGFGMGWEWQIIGNIYENPDLISNNT